MRSCLLIVLVMLTAARLSGQEYFMERITTEDGLPANQILDIEQDSAGFIWFLTYKGVTRYDGTIFKLYPVEQLGNEWFKGISGRKLFKDDYGGIWLSTFAGAVLSYDPLLDGFRVENDSLTRLPAPAYTYYRDSTGVFWMGTAGAGLVRWDPNTKTLKQYQANTHSDSLSDNFISFIAPVNDSLLYLTTTKGSNILDPKTGRFYRLWFNASDGETYKHNVLRHSLRQGKIIYTASYHGLHITNRETMEIEHLTTATTGRSTINHNSIWEMAADHEGKIWITTYGGGVNILDPMTGTFSYLTAENSALPENSLQGVFIDNDQNIWLRTASSGLVKIDLRKQWVRQIDFRKHEWPPATACTQDSEGILWIGTNGGGLIRYNPRTNTYKQFRHDPGNPASLAYDHITALDIDDQGRIWIATGGAGMDRYDPDSGVFTHYPYMPDDQGVSNAALSTLSCYGDKVYWVTFGNGFGEYDQRRNRFISYQTSEDTGTRCDIRNTRLVHSDGKGNLWVATRDGLIMRPAGEGDFRDMIRSDMAEVPLSSTDISFFGEQSDREYILMNFGGDVLEFTLTDNGMIRFGKVLRQGTNRRGGIVHINDREIWSVAASGLLLTMRNSGEEILYDQDDGLLGKEFSPMPGKTHEPVQVASLYGLNLLDLQKRPSQEISPRPVLHQLTVLNRPVIVNEADSVHGLKLARQLNYTEHLDLAYEHKEFTITYGALQFYAPGAASYRYRLLGFRDDWVESGKMNRASYTNLDPGTYTFEVQASLFPGAWGPVKTLLIRVAPPFWMTWWFITLVIMVAAGLLYLLHRYRLQKAVAVANLRTQIAQDLHDDIGSSLTKISLYSSLIEEKEKNDFAGQIGTLSREVISQMSDIVWSVDQKNDTMGDLIVRMRQFADETLSDHGIRVDFESDASDQGRLLNPLVRQNYYLIFKEAINNVVKHSGARNVRIRLRQRQDRLEMEITDDGRGIGGHTKKKAQDSGGYPLNSGNGLGNMKKRAERIGEPFGIHSSNGSGTTIRVGKPT